MKTATSIFLIGTPLQLINAIEAKNHFILSREDSILLVNAYSTNLEAIKKLLNDEDWSSILYIEESIVKQREHEDNLKKFRFYPVFKRLINSKLRLDTLIKSMNGIRYLFVGFYMSLENLHFINSTSHEEIILLDDGIGTIETNRRRTYRQSLLNSWSLEFLMKSLFKKIFLGYKLKHPPTITYFTIYRIDVPFFDKLIRNDYAFIRQRIGLQRQSNTVYFLGQPLTEIDPETLSEEKYFQYVKQIWNYLTPLRLVYIPHRDEDKSKIKRMKDTLGVEVLELNVPIEWFLICSNEKPKMVVGLVTSALPNCKSLFSGEIDLISFRMKEEDYIKSGIIQSIIETYQYFESISDESFRVIDL